MAELGKAPSRTYDEVAFENFFARFNLQDMKETFIENGFRTCRSLMIVTDEDMKEIGFSSLGLRKELLGAVKEWKTPLMQRTSGLQMQQNKQQPNAPLQSPDPAQGELKRSPEYSQNPQPYTHSQGQFGSPAIAKRESLVGTPILSPGISPIGASAEKFHRIKRNDTCPYPECTWAGLSTHFHCLVCSNFHTNKTERIRRHIQRHEVGESAHELDEYQKVKRENFFIFSAKECPEVCKYSEEGVRHLHCKHCDWRTKKFDSRLLAHFKSHHERHLLQYQATHGIESPGTAVSGIRTVSPLPTMAVQEASQIADSRQDSSALPKPPKLMKMEMAEGEAAMAVHLPQQGGFLNRPNVNEDETTDAATMLENDMSSSKYKCMVCGDTQSLRSSLMREQKGRNGPVDWNKTKQLFAYHRIKTTQPALHFVCQKHIEEFVYFSRAYLSLWSTAGMHSQQPQTIVGHGGEEVAENTLVSGMPVYMMLSEHMNEHYKQEPEEVEEQVESEEQE